MIPELSSRFQVVELRMAKRAVYLGQALSGSAGLLRQPGALGQRSVLLLQAPLQLLAALLRGLRSSAGCCSLGRHGLMLSLQMHLASDTHMLCSGTY